jgi:hypothetical protein
MENRRFLKKIMPDFSYKYFHHRPALEMEQPPESFARLRRLSGGAGEPAGEKLVSIKGEMLNPAHFVPGDWESAFLYILQ